MAETMIDIYNSLIRLLTKGLIEPDEAQSLIYDVHVPIKVSDRVFGMLKGHNHDMICMMDKTELINRCEQAIIYEEIANG